MNSVKLAEKLFGLNFSEIIISDGDDLIMEYRNGSSTASQLTVNKNNLQMKFGFDKSINGNLNGELLAEYFEQQIRKENLNCSQSVLKCSDILLSVLENRNLDESLKMISNLLLSEGNFKSIGLMLFNEAVMTLKCVFFVSKDKSNKALNNFKSFVANIDNKSILTDILFYNKVEYIDLSAIGFEDIKSCFHGKILAGNVFSKTGPTGIVLAQPLFYDKNTEEQFKFYVRMISVAVELNKMFKMYDFAVEDIKYFKENVAKTSTLAQVGKFAATVAHEIKNPLVAIGGFASKLEKYITDPKGKTYLNIVNSEIERLDRIVSDILGYSRQNKLNFEKVEIGELIYSTIELISEKLHMNNIELSIDIDNDKLKVNADVKRIKQVLLNIFENAIHAMEKDGILKISTKSNDKKIYVNIEDTGCGIPDDILSKVFDPFFSTKEHGTGLGLSICKEIINKHGGNIKIKNLNHGACVTIELPLRSGYEE
ncbi:GHKL domain-containing protein [Deferribacteraceae bacterium V6Fe1]|nr:GHKL domain-containing protein [Deferribacteraceae bacterium V6Fe1]